MYKRQTQNELLLDDAKQLVANGCIAVAEGANMPTTLEATEYLQKNNVPVSYTHLDVYKRQVLKLYPDFDCRNYGYAKLSNQMCIRDSLST